MKSMVRPLTPRIDDYLSLWCHTDLHWVLITVISTSVWERDIKYTQNQTSSWAVTSVWISDVFDNRVLVDAENLVPFSTHISAPGHVTVSLSTFKYTDVFLWTRSFFCQSECRRKYSVSKQSKSSCLSKTSSFCKTSLLLAMFIH